jgi:tripartite-type tricarboxylate transporter receptor subunit TctC
MSGEIQMYFGNISDIIEQVRTNKVKLLGISTDHRISQFPDTPTISEIVPNFVFTSWVAYFAPNGTPRPIVEKLSKVVSEVCRDREVIDLLKNLGVECVGGTPENLAAAIRADLPIARSAVDAAGLLLKRP